MSTNTERRGGRPDFSDVSTGRKIPPVHPGEILREEFIAAFGLNSRKLAAAIDVPANRITEIVAGRRDITAETALLLAAYFGTTADFWVNLQKDYDLRVARREHAKKIARVKPLAKAA
jgi:addiction module HigA family antidote